MSAPHMRAQPRVSAWRYERAKAEAQKPPEPEPSTRQRIFNLVTCHPARAADEITEQIIDVLSHPSPGVVEAMYYAGGTHEQMWQAGVTAIKRGEG